MKIYQLGTNIVVDLENPSIEKKYIPIHNSKFLFVSGTLKVMDATDDDEILYASALADVKDQAGTPIGNQDQIAVYLSQFVGSPQLLDKNEATHEELTNPGGVAYADFKELSFVCDGTIDVTINGVTIQYPKTLGGVTVLGETLKADQSSEYSVRFTGTGTVLVTQQK